MTTTGAATLARLAALLADETRAAFCLALLDARAWTAGELARHAGVAASTATEHLNQLVAAGLLVEQRQGRHRYVRLAGPHTAGIIEELAAYRPLPAVPVRSLRAANATAALIRARTCYDHLAGRLAVAIADAMTGAGLLQQSTGFALTELGVTWLTDTVGIDPAALHRSRRPMARSCLDWTERRPHLSGAAGAALCQHVLDRRWAVRIRGSRALRVTPAGAAALRELLSLDAAALDGSDASRGALLRPR
jgi:DNA-binding transcriptional ArsR family regulator